MIRTAALEPPAVIDVSRLPPHAFDWRAPVWWGNTLMMFIETMTVALLIAMYFYTRQNFDHWPPPRVDEYPAIYNPVPDLGAATADAVLLVLGVIPMVYADRVCRKLNRNATLAALGILCAVSVASIVLRAFEFPALKFRWDENAYGSLVWAALVLHATYLVLATAEVGIITLWIALHGLDEKHAADVTMTAVYWYWMVGVWVVLYAVVFWSPRVM